MLKQKSRFLNRNILMSLFFLFLIFFCIHRLFFFTGPGLFENIISYPMYPFISIQNKISTSINNFFNKKETVDQLKSEIELLKKENEELFSNYIQLKSSLNFLEQNSEVMMYKNKYQEKDFILSKIIMRQISGQSHYGFVDKGSNDNLKKDMVVIYKNCIIGRISECYPKFSKIIFVTDSSCKIAAYCSKTNATGIYQGLNDINNASLNFVNHLEDLYQDDLIISSGEGLIYPQGFAIGKITKFSNDGVQYKVSVKPIIDISKIDYCYLMAAR